MIIELCRCGWEIPGVDFDVLPAHQHTTRRRIRIDREQANRGDVFEMHGRWIDQEGFTVLEEEDVIVFHINWKEVARCLS